MGELLNVVEAAKYCKRSKDVLYKDVKQGKLCVAKVGKRRAFYFTVEDLNAYLSGESTVDQRSSTVEPTVPATVDNCGQQSPAVVPVFDVSRRIMEEVDQRIHEAVSPLAQKLEASEAKVGELQEYIKGALKEQEQRQEERHRKLDETMRLVMEEKKNRRPWWRRLLG